MLTQLDGSPGCWGDRSGATGGPVYTAYAAHAAYTVYAAYAAYAVYAAHAAYAVDGAAGGS